MIIVSVCLPSDALSQHLPSYLGFSYLGCGISLYGCSSKAQLLLLTVDEGYLLTAAPPDLERGVAPLGLCTHPAAAPWTWGSSSRPLPLTSDLGWLLSTALAPLQYGSLSLCPDLGRGVAPLGYTSAQSIVAGALLQQV